MEKVNRITMLSIKLRLPIDLVNHHIFVEEDEFSEAMVDNEEDMTVENVAMVEAEEYFIAIPTGKGAHC